LNICKNFEGKKILVWGDFILDEYIFTSTVRTSREAPVLVTEYVSNLFKLGGAGNVVMNLKSMGAVPIPVGLIDKKNTGHEINNILSSYGIDNSGLLEIDDYKTPKKSRILSGSENTRKQQILRIDTLNNSEISKKSHDQLFEILVSLIPKCDTVIISDYLKEAVTAEMFSKLIGLFPEKIFILDSRDNLLEFKGVSYVTPNEPEIKKLFPSVKFRDKEDFLASGKDLIKILKCRGVVLKRGHEGMIIFEKDTEPVIIPIHGSSEIVDVTGAGDTVISLIALGLNSGFSLIQSAKIANTGASVVVMKEGAYPLKPAEIEAELSDVKI